jgi:hypothetical protein
MLSFHYIDVCNIGAKAVENKMSGPSRNQALPECTDSLKALQVNAHKHTCMHMPVSSLTALEEAASIRNIINFNPYAHACLLFCD